MNPSPPPPETVSVSLQGRVAIVTLKRPEVMNAINMQMRADLRQTFEALQRDPGVGAVVLTGSGERAFSAGMDLREFAQVSATMSVPEVKRLRASQSEGIAGCDLPVLAAVNGLAIGGGLELALLCDIIFAVPEASFAFAEVKRGLMPGNGGTQRLARRIGQSRAIELILTGRTIDATEALSFGLVDYVVLSDNLVTKAVELAAQMAAQAPIAVRMAKAAIRRGADLPLDDGIRLEQDLAAFVYTTEDAKEGPLAFLEKRAPTWRGR